MEHQHRGEQHLERITVLKNKRYTDSLFFEHYFRYIFAKKFVKNRDVLDCACGTGYGTYQLAGEAKRVLGVDKSSAALAVASSEWRKENISYLQKGAENLSELGRTFDAVVSFETLEHLKNPGQLVEQVYDLLHDGGIFIVSTPNKDTYRAGLDPNIFHLHELSQHEFMNLLSRKFRQVQLFAQLLADSVPPREPVKRSFLGNIKEAIVQMGMLEKPWVYPLYLLYIKKRYWPFVPPPGSYKNYTYMIAVCTK